MDLKNSNKVITLKDAFNQSIFFLCVFSIAIGTSLTSLAQIQQNNSKSLDKVNLWQTKDLIQPAALATILSSKTAKKPMIFNIGVVENIKGAQNLGAASKKDNLERLKQRLKGISKNSMVVIYCGCCPFDNCPNIRPAFSMIKSLGFYNGKLLNLPVNLKQDWISKAFPMAAE